MLYLLGLLRSRANAPPCLRSAAAPAGPRLRGGSELPLAPVLQDLCCPNMAQRHGGAPAAANRGPGMSRLVRRRLRRPSPPRGAHLNAALLEKIPS